MIANRTTKRRGYTLSEVLLVLGVIAGVAALAQPALRSSLGDSRLRSAARQVRTELAKARLKAMQSGLAQCFRYQLDNRKFEVVPAETMADELNGSASADDTFLQQTASLDQTAGSQTANSGLQSETEPAVAKVVQQDLPDGVMFDPVEEHLTAAVDEEGWSDPIVFYPNGRAADATIRLRGERGAVVDVSLRGLTGVATASKPRHEKAIQ
jgi:prepilin-type N-terminal cleavage/methylation domain-containing protein